MQEDKSITVGCPVEAQQTSHGLLLSINRLSITPKKSLFLIYILSFLCVLYVYIFIGIYLNTLLMISSCTLGHVYVIKIIFFGGGWVFFLKRLFRDYEVHHWVVLLVFSATFMLSCTMFELVIFEIVGVLDTSSRYFHWNIGLYAMLFTLTVLIPFYIAYFIVSNLRLVPKNRSAHVLLTVCAWLVYVYFFWKIGDPFPILSPKHGLEPRRRSLSGSNA